MSADAHWIFLTSILVMKGFMHPDMRYFRTENGMLISEEARNEPDPIMREEYKNMEITETRRDRWVIYYDGENGKRVKVLIPNAYPGLEEFMKER